MTLTRLLAAGVVYLSLQNVALGMLFLVGYWERNFLVAAILLGVGFLIGVPALTVALGQWPSRSRVRQ